MNEKSLQRRLDKLEAAYKVTPIEDCRAREEWPTIRSAFHQAMMTFSEIEQAVLAALATIDAMVCITMDDACDLLVAAIEDFMPVRVYVADLLEKGRHDYP